MKFLCLIFSIYVVLLSACPCADENDPLDLVKRTHQIASENDHSDASHEETCSPFCACSCCGCQGFQMQSSPVVTLTIQSPIVIKLIPYNSVSSSQFIAHIWQPPKVSSFV